MRAIFSETNILTLFSLVNFPVNFVLKKYRKIETYWSKTYEQILQRNIKHLEKYAGDQEEALQMYNTKELLL